jgi:hypothetical protein
MHLCWLQFDLSHLNPRRSIGVKEQYQGHHLHLFLLHITPEIELRTVGEFMSV